MQKKLYCFGQGLFSFDISEKFGNPGFYWGMPSSCCCWFICGCGSYCWLSSCGYSCLSGCCWDFCGGGCSCSWLSCGCCCWFPCSSCWLSCCGCCSCSWLSGCCCCPPCCCCLPCCSGSSCCCCCLLCKITTVKDNFIQRCVISKGSRVFLNFCLHSTDSCSSWAVFPVSPLSPEHPIARQGVLVDAVHVNVVCCSLIQAFGVGLVSLNVHFVFSVALL